MTDSKPEQPAADTPFYTMDDLVQMGVSQASRYNYRKDDRITFRKIADRTVCLRSDLNAFLNALPKAE